MLIAIPATLIWVLIKLFNKLDKKHAGNRPLGITEINKGVQYCTRCGQKLAADAEFCPVCGTKKLCNPEKP